AGFLVALLAYKPQIAGLLGVALALAEGRQAVLGMAVGVALLAAAGEAVAPGWIGAFRESVPAAVATLRELPGYNWGRQVTPTSFWRVLLDGPGTAATALGIASSALAVLSVAFAAWRAKAPADNAGALNDAGGRRRDAARNAAISTAALALPLAAPYFMDYDLLLLAVPAAMALGSPRSHSRIVLLGWLALWVAAYLNVDAVATWRVGLVAPVVATLAAAGVWPTFRSGVGGLGRRGRADTIPGPGVTTAQAPPLPVAA
ncbi:MAG: hypothetical protein JWO31_1571, partial [Phycisphaerales bacterium]|nr:hypothetical protein [Phycisphaerales bacterium]